MRRFALILTLAVFLSLFWGTAAFACGTGLNTIWVTNIIDEGTFEWDLDLSVSDTEFAGGFFAEDGRFLSQAFYATILPRLEIGVAFNGEREVGPFVLYAKYLIFDEEEDDFPVSVAVGVDNVIGTQARFVSEPIQFIVIGKNFDRANGYIGFAHNASTVQDDDSLFGGFDYALNEDLTFQADYYGYSDNEEGIISGGLCYAWVNHIGLNGWVSYDTASENTIFTAEFAFSGRFDNLEA